MKKLILVLLLGTPLLANCQIGLTRAEVLQTDTIFESCEEFDDFIYCVIHDNVVIYNLEHNICTSVTIISDVSSEFYLQFIRYFLKIDKFQGSTGLYYSHKDTLICKIHR